MLEVRPKSHNISYQLGTGLLFELKEPPITSKFNLNNGTMRLVKNFFFFSFLNRRLVKNLETILLNFGQIQIFESDLGLRKLGNLDGSNLRVR